MAVKIMPNNLEAEKSVLGASFISNYALQKAIEHQSHFIVKKTIKFLVL